jgi:8-oxo-dGTP diphosphatase
MPEQKNKEVRVGVSIIVKNGDRILLLKRQGTTHGNGTWAPPGGHMNFGESPEQAAIRETQEETAVNIDTVKFRVITNDVFETEGLHYITIWIEAKYVSGEPRINAPDEMSELAWFTWDNLPEPLFLPLQNLLTGKTYPSQTTSYDKVGAAIETQSIPAWEEHAQVFQNMAPGETFVARSGLDPEPSETVSNVTESSVPASSSTPTSGSTNTGEAVRATPRPGERPDLLR